MLNAITTTMNSFEHHSVHLAVIIVSYNTCDLLAACLRALAQSAVADADRLALEVIVVDNASADESAEMVAREFQLRMLLLQLLLLRLHEL